MTAIAVALAVAAGLAGAVQAAVMGELGLVFLGFGVALSLYKR